MKYAHIVGWGSYLPDKILTNNEIAETIETTHEWIYSRTGIVERRIAGKQETTATMAFEAAARELADARLDVHTGSVLRPAGSAGRQDADQRRD